MALAPDPRVIVKCIYFHFNLVIQIDIGARYGEYLLLLLLIYYPLIIDFEAINNVLWNTQNALDRTIFVLKKSGASCPDPLSTSVNPQRYRATCASVIQLSF